MRTSATDVTTNSTGSLTSQQRQAVGNVCREADASGEDRLLVVGWLLEKRVDPLPWLAAQTGYPQIFWRSRWSTEQYGGAGSAATVRTTGAMSLHDALTQAADLLSRIECAADVPPVAHPRLFGGAAFDPRSRQPDAWLSFGDAHFVLPEALLHSDTTHAHLIVTLCVSPSDSPPDVMSRLEQMAEHYWPNGSVPSPAIPSGRQIERGIDVAQWQGMVDEALRMIATEELQKVVLSRSIHWHSDEEFSPWALVGRLRDVSEGSYCFGFELGAGETFLSATPERLVRLAGRDVDTDCIAGTVARDSDPERDEALSRDLLNSMKDRREHGYVIEGIVETLRGLCTHTDVGGEPWLMRLPTVQHLVTSARATLRDGVSYADVVSQLHPTPAVGGTPRAAALAAIRRLEPEGRGWYAGPVGWIGRGTAEFAVGIRSALVAGRDVRMFTGAGIVNGSLPDREWAETDAKAQSILKIVQR
ncbi:MAG: isochorismate synthase [candidate division Zixibacteria bacterium]|nr:isochorismate synthase [candidate division Zixibacteria bacterium]